MSKTALTIIFATFNGAATLPRMLQNLKSLDLNGIDLELLAVDNASTDNSAEIIQTAARDLPIKLICEPRRGKNRALNSALSAARGDLVVFTDDDVLPKSAWLQEFIRAANRHADFDLFGGRIVPDWPTEPAAWITEGVPRGAAFGTSEPEWMTGPTDPSRIWGANMMVRAHVFRAGHRFSESIGPAAGNYIMGSETEFNKRVSALGHRCFFVADATVGHIIRSGQLDQNWLKGRAFRYGRGLCASASFAELNETAVMLGVPRWQLRECAKNKLKHLTALARRDRTSAMRALWDFECSRGYMHEWRARRSALAGTAQRN